MASLERATVEILLGQDGNITECILLRPKEQTTFNHLGENVLIRATSKGAIITRREDNLTLEPGFGTGRLNPETGKEYVIHTLNDR